MSKRITKHEAAAILGVHEKTLERYLKDPEFMELTGGQKNKFNGRVSFDEMFFRTYAANATGDDDLRIVHDHAEAIDAVEVPAGAMVKAPAAAIERRGDDSPGVGGLELAAAISRAFILPGKIYLTLHEAKELTGFPLAQLRQFSEMKFGRRVIKRSKLEKI